MDLGVAACLAGLPILPARASLVVMIDSTRFGRGEQDGGRLCHEHGTVSLDAYGFDLQIANSGLDGTQLAFATNQSFGYLNNPSYVFYGDSNAAQTSTSPGYTSSSNQGIPTTRFWAWTSLPTSSVTLLPEPPISWRG